MKCFTVSDTVEKRIFLTEDAHIRVGAEGFCSEVPLSKALTDSFAALRAIGKSNLALKSADIIEEPLCIVPEKVVTTRWGKIIESDIALVHLTTTSPGQLWLEANCYDEQIIQTRYGQRVRRAYHRFPTPMSGVEVLATGTGANGEPHALLRMLPGSSFRICRDTIDIPPEMLVVWPGSNLRLIVPEKHKKRLRKEKGRARQS